MPVIENPILNSAFVEPTRHFRFDEQGITNEIAETRRSSGYFVPIAQPRKRDRQLRFQTEWTEDRYRESEFINSVRRRVGMWRVGGYVGVTAITGRLLAYWSNPEREKNLFFCQVEAVETAIYLTEVARRYGDSWIENDAARGERHVEPRASARRFQDGDRIGQDRRHGDAHRLAGAEQARGSTGRALFGRVPASSHPASRSAIACVCCCRPIRTTTIAQRDILPPDLLERLGQARIVITNYHAFLPRERDDAARLTKAILSQRASRARSPRHPIRSSAASAAIWAARRTSSSSTTRPTTATAGKPDGRGRATLTGDERKEAEQRDEEARVWLSGLEAVKRKLGVKAVYDLSATPFFLQRLRLPGRHALPVGRVGLLARSTPSRAGIVKMPRVPVADNSMTGDQPTYRDLWLRIRDDLPKKGRKTDAVGGEPKLPAELAGRAAQPLRQLREVVSRAGSTTPTPAPRGLTPPVFVVVCNNTNVSKLVFDYVAGWDEDAAGRHRRSSCPGALAALQQRRRTAQLVCRGPNTILVDSRAARVRRGDERRSSRRSPPREIEEFKAEYRARFPGRDAGRPHRRGPAARGDEHRRQGRQARRARPLRRVGVDAHRGLGREHRHPHPRRPRLRHAAPVRAGRRPRAAAHELRRERRGLVRPGVRRGVRRAVLVHPGSRHRRHGSQARPDAHARACARRSHRLRDHLPPARRLPLRGAQRSGCAREFTDGFTARALHGRRPDQDRESRRSWARRASTRWTISGSAATTRSRSCWPS